MVNKITMEENYMDVADMEEQINELRDYVELEGTEVGEVCALLCDISQYPDYFSEEFNNALANELLNQLNNFKNNSIITEEEEKRTVKYKRLEWKY